MMNCADDVNNGPPDRVTTFLLATLATVHGCHLRLESTKETTEIDLQSTRHG
jgi:hypothetical protein